MPRFGLLLDRQTCLGCRPSLLLLCLLLLFCPLSRALLPLLLVHSMLSDLDDRSANRPGDLSHHQHAVAPSIGEEFYHT